MRKLFALVASLMSGLIPGAAARAQTPPVPTPIHQPNLSVGDLHRYEMDRLRNQAEQGQALARSQALQTQMTLQALQAQRQPPLFAPPPLTGSVSAPTLEEAHRQREATEAATAAARRATGQIDTWLDRRPQ